MNTNKEQQDVNIVQNEKSHNWNRQKNTHYSMRTTPGSTNTQPTTSKHAWEHILFNMQTNHK